MEKQAPFSRYSPSRICNSFRFFLSWMSSSLALLQGSPGFKFQSDDDMVTTFTLFSSNILGKWSNISSHSATTHTLQIHHFEFKQSFDALQCKLVTELLTILQLNTIFYFTQIRNLTDTNVILIKIQVHYNLQS